MPCRCVTTLPACPASGEQCTAEPYHAAVLLEVNRLAAPDTDVFMLSASQANVARTALHCLSQLLSALDPTNWPAALAPFTLLTSYITDGRPKVSVA